MKINNLTATQVKKLSYNGNGKFTAHSVDSSCKLYLFCYPSGAKTFKFRKNNSGYITIDIYSHTTLAEAREKAIELYKQELKGELDAPKSQHKISEIFFKWLDIKMPPLKEEDKNYKKYIERRRKMLNKTTKWILRPFGDKPISELTKQDIIKQTTQKERMNYPTASKVIPIFRDLLKYSRAQGYIKEYSFILEIIDDMDALYPRAKTCHRKAPNDKERLRQIMQEVKKSQIKPMIKNLFFLSLIMGQRPHQFRELEWSRVDLKNGFLFFGEDDNKTGLDNVRIPLPKQAIEILKTQRSICEPKSDLVFQSNTFSKKSGWQISSNTLMKNIKNLGINDLHAHGFRSILSTFAIRASEIKNGVSCGKFEKRIIDEVTLHTKGSDVDRAYFRDFNTAEHLRLLQWWADYLDELEKIEAYKEC
ncbi:tyrosine-type recombinase/integrase [Campylobacter sp. RM16192]|uniref:tyrosine-type recombinase/integrase n=1 Tax=Campylobacter sp. RM16192 TaxID=1660080 RepID=UPI001452A5AB|nr:tyrosine-type recombinase/integrase [Campylobacter sp. RM16192]QCD52850.1 site-specific recombinase, phage integrase family (DUF4102 domain) [Campylobacter sp. RM16192]